MSWASFSNSEAMPENNSAKRSFNYINFFGDCNSRITSKGKTALGQALLDYKR